VQRIWGRVGKLMVIAARQGNLAGSGHGLDTDETHGPEEKSKYFQMGLWPWRQKRTQMTLKQRVLSYARVEISRVGHREQNWSKRKSESDYRWYQMLKVSSFAFSSI
jgi:hypothetical protein